MLRLALACALISSCALALPGGYTANGGVFNPDRHLDYMEEARHAGQYIQIQYTCT